MPLVELETVHHVRYVTDSAGWIAAGRTRLDEPARLLPCEEPRLRTCCGRVRFCRPGAEPATRRRSGRFVCARTNIAQRLYRITGEGIYRDSLLLGKPVPLRNPRGTGRVAGQDSAMAVPYRDRIFWFWGDTNRLRYPLGHFWMAGATSDLPGPTSTLTGASTSTTSWMLTASAVRQPDWAWNPGPIWIDAVCVLPDEQGRERLVCHYAHMKDLGKMLDHGLAVYNDETQQFDKLASLDMNELLAIPWPGTPDSSWRRRHAVRLSR